MNKTTDSAIQNDAPADEAAIEADADVLHAADAWQVKGFSVADAVQAQTTFNTRLAQLENSKTAAKAHWEAIGIYSLDLTRYEAEASAVAVVSGETARLHRALPIRKVDNKLWVAMENPIDIEAIDAVRVASRCEIIPLASMPEGALDTALFIAYSQMDALQPEPEPMENRANENTTAELIALVRDLQNEVRDLKQEVLGLKKQVAAQQLAPPTFDARPTAYPAPRVFRATPTSQPPFPLFRD